MVLEMGRWWPSMEVFRIGGDPYSAGSSTGSACAPLSLLRDIVQVWATTLQLLWITFNLGDQLLLVPESNHLKLRDLEFITVAALPDHRFVNTAEFLAALTRQPFHVRDNRQYTGSSSRWNQVNQLIREMHQNHKPGTRND